MLVQRGVQFIGNVGGREGERGGKAKNGLLALAEMRTGFELRDVAQLLFGDLCSSADSRVDVNSKRTPNHQRDLELGEFFQAHRNRAPGSGVEVHADGPPKVLRVESSNAQAARKEGESADWLRCPARLRIETSAHLRFAILPRVGIHPTRRKPSRGPGSRDERDEHTVIRDD